MVLIVDDEEQVRMLLCDCFRSAGFAVISHTNAQDALGDFEPAKFDLVVTDRTMPKMGGEAFVREVRRLDPDVPVIMVTGDKGLHALPEGVTRLLDKPFELADLLQVVKEVLAPAA